MPSKACAVLDIYKDSVLITRAALACRKFCAGHTRLRAPRCIAPLQAQFESSRRATPVGAVLIKTTVQ